MRYKILGFIVWHGGQWYIRRRLPDRRLLAAGAVAVGIVIALIGGMRNRSSS